jgi:hypothetical protein
MHDLDYSHLLSIHQNGSSTDPSSHCVTDAVHRDLHKLYYPILTSPL